MKLNTLVFFYLSFQQHNCRYSNEHLQLTLVWFLSNILFLARPFNCGYLLSINLTLFVFVNFSTGIELLTLNMKVFVVLLICVYQVYGHGDHGHAAATGGTPTPPEQVNFHDPKITQDEA